ncbi:glucose/ribitol dehydrogenase [Artemisia annua]|uniref:Glucose/ribitol dehydrogenase n=1 Tax=Artemisia annua TaxID=35608 RepID=A0A2U1M761_ARTAN|nr:glucose/ribitol dehydrogenase [Artemisia annua]
MDSKSSKIGRRFEGKVAIVTASTQGIGFSIAQRLALEGASVVISSRRQGKRRKGTVPVSCEEEMSQDLETFKEQSLRFERNVDEAVKKLKQQGIEVLGVVCHVSNAQQRKSLVEQTVQRNVDEAVKKLKQQGIEVLGVVCHVSNAQQRKSLVEQTVQDASPHLTKGSSIVFISSLSAYQPPSSMAMYGVTKTALLGLTKALATEMAPHTRVNCVAPGTVPTHFASFITENDTIAGII